jgi:hypothetical protein
MPQHARGLGDLPLAMVGHEASIRDSICVPVSHLNRDGV